MGAFQKISGFSLLLRKLVRKAYLGEKLLFFNVPINGGLSPHKWGLFRKPYFPISP
jgi:hypothetical protein